MSSREAKVLQVNVSCDSVGKGNELNDIRSLINRKVFNGLLILFMC